ncbi:MAG: cobalamin B12-binding domain-containing protein, partial [Actinomycetota bacterium]
APTGVAGAAGVLGDGGGRLRALATRMQNEVGGPPRILLAKPGLDGHSNGAEQIAVAARDAGMEVIYQGIRLTPEQIAAVARDEDPDAIGLSILSGSHMELVPQTLDHLRRLGVEAPLVVGGIIPAEDQPALLSQGVAAVFTPKDYELGEIVESLADLALRHRHDVEASAR